MNLLMKIIQMMKENSNLIHKELFLIQFLIFIEKFKTLCYDYVIKWKMDYGIFKNIIEYYFITI